MMELLYGSCTIINLHGPIIQGKSGDRALMMIRIKGFEGAISFCYC